jgi:hypothetical protein
VGDLNGDGQQDLAVANFGTNNVSILLGNGAGSFGAATNFDIGIGPLSVAVGDFNGDGKQDLAVANVNSHDVSILLGDGAGAFGPATNVGVGNSPFEVASGDFNADGRQDLAVVNNGSNNVSIVLGNGDGGFASATNFDVGTNPTSIASGDFNGDGKQDFATTNNVSNNVSVLLGDGAGSFSAATNFDAGSGPRSVALGDFNGDGKQDLAVSNQDSNNVSVLLGNGAGSFGAATNFGVNIQPFSVAVGDFNGDGKPDLATANRGSDNVSVLWGDGSGSFGAATNFGVGQTPITVAIGDFNGDGKQDLATANANSANVSILLRDCAPPPTPTPTATPTPTPTPSSPIWYVSKTGSGTVCTQAQPCASIAQAISNAAPGGDTIEVAAGTYNEHDLTIDKSLTIQGASAKTTIVDAQQQGRVFVINSGVTVNISNLTITGGKTSDGVVLPGSFGTTLGTPGQDGGGILNNGTLLLFQCNLTNNRAGNGGSIATSAGAGGSGGGLSNAGSMTVSDSTIRNNQAGIGGNGIGAGAGGSGGGIINTGTLTINQSTISDNQAGNGGSSAISVGAGGSGGGIRNTGTLTINQSTVSNNQTGNGGSVLGNLGGVSPGAPGSGGGINGPINGIRNTIVANNISSSGPDINGSAISQGHNLIGKSDGSSGFDTTCLIAQDKCDKFGSVASPLNPLVGPLQYNGGPTLTHGLATGSPAVNAGDDCVTQAAHCGDSLSPQLLTDQRTAGFTRAFGAHVDIGAFEQTPAPPPTLGNYPDTSIPSGAAGTVTPDAPPTSTVRIEVSISADFQGTGDPLTGVVQIKDPHPVGTYTVTVTAFNVLEESITRTFTLSVIPCTPMSFAVTNFGVGPTPRSVAMGDFNGDGKQDLATANQGSNNVSVLLGNGAGGFSAPTNFGVGAAPVSVAVADFNKDGKQDLVTANFDSGSVSILLGNGAGGFSAPTNFSAGSFPETRVESSDSCRYCGSSHRSARLVPECRSPFPHTMGVRLQGRPPRVSPVGPGIRPSLDRSRGCSARRWSALPPMASGSTGI